MADNPRIEELRKRLEREPGSPLFAQYAEELRKAGEIQQAIRVCRDGLAKHAGYATARITLGRALATAGDMSGARQELEAVVKVAPDNVLARRALDEVVRLGLGSAPGDSTLPVGVKVATAAATGVAGAPIDGADAAPGVPAEESGEPHAEPSEVSAGVADADEEYEIEPPPARELTGPVALTFRPLLEEPEAAPQQERPVAPVEVAFSPAVVSVRTTVAPPPSAVAAEAPASTVAGVSPAGIGLGRAAIAGGGDRGPTGELASPTLAELYVAQGSPERAVAMYEQLLGRDPGNARLAERLSEVRELKLRAAAGVRSGSRDERARAAIKRLESLRKAFREGAPAAR